MCQLSPENDFKVSFKTQNKSWLSFLINLNLNSRSEWNPRGLISLKNSQYLTVFVLWDYVLFLFQLRKESLLQRGNTPVLHHIFDMCCVDAGEISKYVENVNSWTQHSTSGRTNKTQKIFQCFGIIYLLELWGQYCNLQKDRKKIHKKRLWRDRSL